MKIVINRRHGGFGLSERALLLYCHLKGVEDLYDWEIDRTDPVLVSVVCDLGSEADGPCSSLKVVDVPDGVDWVLEEYDGMEWIAERHRIWN